MTRRVSIKDVAERAGVSWKTVSNVVNDRPVVREATRDRVLRAIDELGYVPNTVGRELRGGPTRVLALVIPELTNPYFARLAERMQAAARERGYSVSVEVSLRDASMERAHVLGHTGRPVDAVIISPSALALSDLAERRSGPPVVLLGESMPGLPRVVHVAIDNVAAAAEVVRHVVDCGSNRPMFLGAESGSRSTGAERLAGFRAACRFAGITVPPERLVAAEAWTREAGGRVMREVLRGCAPEELPDAVVCGNDLLAVGALAALEEAGLSVPDDVAVTGWDDIPEAAWVRPGLTTVAPDMEALVSGALEAALRDVGSGGTDGDYGGRSEWVIDHRLVARESTSSAFDG